MMCFRASATGLCLAAAVVCGSCDDATAPTVTSVELRASADSLFFGDSLQIIADATGDSAAVAQLRVVWTSSDTTIAVVDSAGKVLGLSTGVATISAQHGHISDAFDVRVVLKRFDGGISFASMSRGFHPPLCALTTAGVPHCADTGATAPTVFAPLPKNGDLAFVTFSTSQHSRCGLTDAGLMYCWGGNGHGHWGNGLPSSFRSDTAPSLGAGGRTFISLSVGGHAHTCGVNAADSVVYCFGHDDLNQVGRGSPDLDDTVVAPTGGAPKGIAVNTADARNCLVGIEGTLMCWGRSIATPTPVLVSEPIASVSTGRFITCAIAVSKTMYCWGANGVGEATPTLMSADLTFDTFAPEEDSHCAITPAGALYCWGLFHPRSVSRRLDAAWETPVRVLPGMTFKSYAATTSYGCAITTDGRLFCW